MKKAKDLCVSTKHQNQIERADNRTNQRLWDVFIGPSLQDDLLPVPHLFERKDGNYSHAEMEELLAKAERNALEPGQDEYSALCEQTEFFTNPLKLAEFDASKRIPGKRSGYTPPGERISNGGWIALTFEYDGETPEDLETQLDWFAGKRETCRFQKAHTALSGFADYRGYSAVFSGSKSVHIHTIWDTRHLSAELSKAATVSIRKLWHGDVPDHDLASLHWIVWAEVAAIINDNLGTNVPFDPALRNYTQKRRFPWGIRTFTKAVPLHSFDVGDQISQTVLQEHLAKKTLAPIGSEPMFSFAKSLQTSQVRRHGCNKPSQRQFKTAATAEVLQLLQDYLSDSGWGEYPKPVRLDFDGTNNVVYFQNNRHDVHPSTFVRGDFRKLYLAGRGSPSGDVFLPNELTLDETLDLLIPSNTHLLEKRDNLRKQRLPIGLERFRQSAVDQWSARREAGRLFKNIGNRSGVTLVQAHEGLGKTYALFSGLMEHRWDADAERFQNKERADSTGANQSDVAYHRGPTIIACGSYDQLSEKSRELLSVENAPASVVILKSISKLYAEARENCSVQQALTKLDAGKEGFPHLLAAIQDTQPEVYAEMKRLRDQPWLNSKGAAQFRHDAVVVMVHSMLKVWPHALFARAFLHPEFPDDFDISTVKNYADQMNPFRVIYDEVGWEDLVAVVPEADRDLAYRIRSDCRATSQQDWDEASLPDRTSAYARSGTADLTFDEVDELIRLKLTVKHRYHVDAASYPFGKGPADKNFYAKAHGATYYCRPYRWFNSLGCPVIILTTEDLPRLVGQSIARSSNPAKPFHTIRLTETPHILPDRVQLRFDERARMARKADGEEEPLASVIDLAKELLSDGYDFVISDGLGAIGQPYEGSVSSHVSARGRNDLQGKKIASIMTYPSLEQYKRLCILAKAMVLTNPISIAMRDQAYQSFGRNLGFRRKQGQRHDLHSLYIKASLFKELRRLSGQMDKRLSPDRYECVLVAK